MRFAEAVALWNDAVAATREPALGLIVARELAAGDYGPIEFAARACDTIGDAFARVGRFHRLMNDRAEVSIAVEGELARVTYVRPRELAAMPAAYVEYVLGAWTSLGAQLLGEGVPAEQIPEMIGQASEALDSVPLIAETIDAAGVGADGLEGLAALIAGELGAEAWVAGLRRSERSRRAA